jgi:hypothetical protein
MQPLSRSSLRAVVLLATAPLALLPATLRAQAARAATPPGMSAIRTQDLKRDLYYMASDAMRGREAGTLDEMRASMWVADQARKAGLQPAGDDGTYFQWWSIRRVQILPASTVTVGNRSLALWTEAAIGNTAPATVDAPTVFVGAGTEADLAHVDVKGKVAVAQLVTPPNAPGPNVSLWEWRYTRLAMAVQGRRLLQAGAAAVILVADSVAETGFEFVSVYAERGVYDVDDPSVAKPPAPRPPVILVHRNMLDALRADGQPASIHLQTYSYTYPSVNIVGKVPGTDATLRNEYVLFSGHQDHDGVRFPVAGDSTWNGADDNASTSVALLAIARAWVAHPGKRSALFVWHGAEERGLLGSRYHAAHPVVPLHDIVAVLNGDMMGRNNPDTASILGVQPPHRNSTALVNMAIQADNMTGKFVIDSTWDRPTHPEGWYFRSDHLPYARLGVPALFFSTNLHPDYHTPRDEPSRIDYAKLTRMTQWMYATGWLVANAAQRPALDPGFKLER